MVKNGNHRSIATSLVTRDIIPVGILGWEQKNPNSFLEVSFMSLGGNLFDYLTHTQPVLEHTILLPESTGEIRKPPRNTRRRVCGY